MSDERNAVSWHPIETAPIDRTQILVRGRYAVTGYVSDVYHSWWDEDRKQWARWPHTAFPPTHWMLVEDLPND